MVYDSLDSTFVKGRNIVFLETKDQGFVSNITSILNSFINDSTEIILTTTNKNRAFEGVNISNYYMSNLNFHYPSINKPLDFNLYSDFINNFNNIYNYIPNKYVIRGYDVMLDLLLRLSSDEANISGSNSYETEHIENKFKYLKNQNNSMNRNILIGMYEIVFSCDQISNQPISISQGMFHRRKWLIRLNKGELNS